MVRGVKTKKKAKKSSADKDFCQYKHLDKRLNNPPVGLVTPESDCKEDKAEYRYDPHLDPELQFDSQRASIEKLIDNALASDDKDALKQALKELKRLQEPYLNWTGKAERTSFEVDTVSLHVHERIDPRTILETATRDADKRPPAQMGLFDSAFDNLPLRDAIDFYKHEKGWSNRLIAGDSLLIMNSLLQKESMAGQVQMIYIDPPYGIKYGSNFQPFVNKRDVKDRQDEDLTQEPEMIKAFRDTWELGLHSYLTYLRDRLLLAKELLHESGSLFVQISDENVHHVRELMDEIFGVENFISVIILQKTSAPTDKFIPVVSDFVIWYGKNGAKTKYNQIYKEKSLGNEGSSQYKFIEQTNGEIRKLSKDEYSIINSISGKCFAPSDASSSHEYSLGKEPVFFQGKEYTPGGRYWSTSPDGMRRLRISNRLVVTGRTLFYKRYLEDFPVFSLSNIWTDTSSSFGSRIYVVQTTEKTIERFILMTTDPGDLILDPTCGSGTTAYVAEKWGRRWITCDTSRVAVALAKQRLMTAAYDCFYLKYPDEGLKGGFDYKTVPHVTLKSIANNPEIDIIYEQNHPKIEKALSELNKALKKKLQEWEVPFDFPDEWPEKAKKLFEDFHAARQDMQKRMDASIAANADQEILYDQPRVDKSRVRVTGPFSVEAVPFATVLSLDEMETPSNADVTVARSGESARQHEWKDELLKTGVRGKGGQKIEFAEIETLPGTHYLHAVGMDKASGDRIAVSFGPEFAPLEQRQVELALEESGLLKPKVKMVLFAAFSFDPEAAKDIDETKWPGMTVIKVQMNTDLLTGDLKKNRASNESFWLMGQPDVYVKQTKAGWQVEMHGFDYYNTRKGEIESGGKDKIAMWLLDTDYDGRSLFPSQVFFPMTGEKDGWAKLAKVLNAQIDEDRIEAYRGTVSLPFQAGKYNRVAIKIIDDRGIESLKIIPLE